MLKIEKIELQDVINFINYDKDDISFVQIGANDGEMDDPINNYITKYKWSGVMLEPDFFYFEKLKKKYQDYKNIICLQLGIGNGNIKTLFKINPDKINKEYVSWVGGLGTCIEEQLTQYKWINKDDIIQIEIITVPLMNILCNYKNLDLLLVDAEGMDVEILNQLDLNYLQPKVVIFENDPINNLPYNKDLLNSLLIKFSNFNYRIFQSPDTIILKK